MPQRDLQHLPRGGHFEVQRHAQGSHQAGDIFIANVAPVLSKMCGDAVGTRLLREQRCLDWIGMVAAPCIADSSHMVDVDPETQREGCAHGAQFFLLPGLCAGIAASSGGISSTS